MITRVFRGKLVIIGDMGVGKTALSQMVITDGRDYPKNYSMTFAADINTKLIPIPGTRDGVELLVYDSPGIDLYVDLLNKFWNEPDLLLIVFDVTKRKSLENVSEWMRIARKSKWRGNNGSPLASVLLGNKVDLQNRRVCSDEEAVQLADSLNMKYFSGSVKTNQGLEDPLQYLTDTFYRHCLKENFPEDQ